MPDPVLYEENSMPFEVTIECGVPVDSTRPDPPLTANGKSVIAGFTEAQLFFVDAALRARLEADIQQSLQSR